MKLIEVKNYEELSRAAADMIIGEINAQPDCVLGLATGSTPIGTYDKLIEAYKANEVSFAKVSSINLDEYVGLSRSDTESYRYFMNDHLFDHVDIDKPNTHVPNGLADDLDGECARYDALYDSIGPVDIQLLGIGVNGHIGFNEPDAKLSAATHVVTLSDSTRRANSRNFDSLDDVPYKAITLGMAGIMKAKKIVLLASGAAKRDAIEKTVFGGVDPYVPASFLQLHPDVTVIYDFALAGKNIN